MALPLFYQPGNYTARQRLMLEEDTARHIVQVLRMQPGEIIQITNGTGWKVNGTISRAEKKKCEIILQEPEYTPPAFHRLHLCMAFTKNAGRNEWLLEKATELGVSSITPLITQRSEREKFRLDRWQNIIVAALIQSQQFHLPALSGATPFRIALDAFAFCQQKLIAHCNEEIVRTPVNTSMKPQCETVIFIGPEGDFSREEVQSSIEADFTGISLGSQRLRTETAAMAACAYFNLLNIH